jgi:arsenite methyltransferase
MVSYKPNRPGGFVITDRALMLCSFRSGAKILDLGCGSGATVVYLTEKYGFEVIGLDKNPELKNPTCTLVRAAAEDIPVHATTMDGALLECSFSVMDDQEKVLKECYRILKPNGRLIISDMYARGEPAQLSACLGRIDLKEEILSRIENHGFRVEFFEDFSQQLNTMWGQMIFDQGSEAFHSSLGVTPDTLKRIKCGYCLIIATKKIPAV